MIPQQLDLFGFPPKPPKPPKKILSDDFVPNEPKLPKTEPNSLPTKDTEIPDTAASAPLDQTPREQLADTGATSPQRTESPQNTAEHQLVGQPDADKTADVQLIDQHNATPQANWEPALRADTVLKTETLPEDAPIIAALDAKPTSLLPPNFDLHTADSFAGDMELEAEVEPYPNTELEQTAEIPETAETELAAGTQADDAPGVSVMMPDTAERRSLPTEMTTTAQLNIPPDEDLFKRQYYSMRETAAMFNLPQPLLRHWENEFDVVQPKKNKKGDRHFRPVDIKNLELIYHLLKVKKFTTDGAKEYLRHRNKALDTFELTQRLEKLKLFLLELKAHL